MKVASKHLVAIQARWRDAETELAQAKPAPYELERRPIQDLIDRADILLKNLQRRSAVTARFGIADRFGGETLATLMNARRGQLLSNETGSTHLRRALLSTCHRLRELHDYHQELERTRAAWLDVQLDRCEAVSRLINSQSTVDLMQLVEKIFKTKDRVARLWHPQTQGLQQWHNLETHVLKMMAEQRLVLTLHHALEHNTLRILSDVAKCGVRLAHQRLIEDFATGAPDSCQSLESLARCFTALRKFAAATTARSMYIQLPVTQYLKSANKLNDNVAREKISRVASGTVLEREKVLRQSSIKQYLC